MRGCEPGGGPRAVFVKEKGRSLHSVSDSPLIFWGREIISVAIQAPSLGRERPLVARPECVTTGDALLVVPEVGGGTALAIDTCWDIHFSEGGLTSARPAGVGLWAQFGFWGWWLFYLRWTRGEGLLGAFGDDANGRCGRVR